MEGSKPIYLQIRDDIRNLITTLKLPVGSTLPTEDNLAQHYGTTRLTVRKAIDGLEADGMVRRIRGKGSFVIGSANALDAKPMGFRELTKLESANPTVRILNSCLRPAGNYYGRLFNISPTSQLLSVRRLNFANGVPMSLEEVVVRTDLFPGIEDMDFSVFSLYGYYELNHHAVIKTYEKIDVISLSARDACFLDLKAGNVTLFLDCLSFDAQGLLIENAISYNVGSMGVYTVFN